MSGIVAVCRNAYSIVVVGACGGSNASLPHVETRVLDAVEGRWRTRPLLR